MEDISIKPTGTKYGIVLAVLSIFYSMILYVTDQMLNQTLSYVSILIMVGVIIYAIREYKSLNEGYISFGNGFKLGFLVSAISTAIGVVYNFLFQTFVYTTFKEDSLAMAREKMAENPQMTEEMIDQALSITESMLSPAALVIMGIVGGLVFGAIISLIVAAIMKNDRPPVYLEEE